MNETITRTSFVIDDVVYTITTTRALSRPAFKAYTSLYLFFFKNGYLPTDDDSVKSITRLNKRQWPKAREELQRHVFAKDWSCLKWNEIIMACRHAAAQSGDVYE
jgi:hypothetical protein